MTKTDLLRQLEQSGYAVSGRRVTDWTEKGLLPPLVRGCGDGRAPIYRWVSPEEIFEQAVDVYHLLKWHGRVKNLFAPLWLLGGTVPLPGVRRRLTEKFRRSADRVGTAGQTLIYDIDAIKDAISGIVQSERANKSARDLGVTLADFQTVGELLLNTILNPALDLCDWSGSDVWRAMAPSLTDNQRAFVLPHITAFMWNANRFLSVHRCLDLLESASDADLLAGQSTLCDIRRLARQTADSAGFADMDMFDEILRRTLVLAGPWLICVKLSVGNGAESLVDSLVARWVAYLPRLRL